MNGTQLTLPFALQVLEHGYSHIFLEYINKMRRGYFKTPKQLEIMEHHYWLIKTAYIDKEDYVTINKTTLNREQMKEWIDNQDKYPTISKL